MPAVDTSVCVKAGEVVRPRCWILNSVWSSSGWTVFSSWSVWMSVSQHSWLCWLMPDPEKHGLVCCGFYGARSCWGFVSWLALWDGVGQVAVKRLYFLNSCFQNKQEVEKRGAAKSFSTNSGARPNQKYQKESTRFVKNFQTTGAYRQWRGILMIDTSLPSEYELKQNISILTTSDVTLLTIHLICRYQQSWCCLMAHQRIKSIK